MQIKQILISGQHSIYLPIFEVMSMKKYFTPKILPFSAMMSLLVYAQCVLQSALQFFPCYCSSGGTTVFGLL